MIKKRPHTPREAAAFTLFSMEEEGAWSDGALHGYLDRAALSPRDAALATRLVYGVLQNRSMCDFYLAAFSSVRLRRMAPRVLTCLRLGVYQLTMLDRIPAHAAVGESVELVKHYAHADERTVKFTNGVLRAAARAAEAGTLPRLDCPDKISYYALRYSHPLWLVRAFAEQFGEKEAGQLCAADNADAPLSLRVNTRRATADEVRKALTAAGFTAVPHPTVPHVLLCTGGDVTALPLFQQGLVTVQDAACAACVDILDPRPGTFAVDCCAAPGGKSFLMAEKMQDGGTVLSCDLYTRKLDKIQGGAARLGLHSITVRQADATQPQADLLGRAQAVLCDVPCSGLGIIRKKPEIRYKSETELADLPDVQRRILENCAQYTAPGGTLVYSTCTVLRRENEEVVRAFLSTHPAFELTPFTHPVCGACEDGMVTLLPHRHHTDGFFIARLRRRP